MTNNVALAEILQGLIGTRRLLSHGFFPHFTKAVEVVGDEVRHVVYAGPKFHPEVHEWAVDDAIFMASKQDRDIANAVEEFLRPITAPTFSIMAYSMKDGRTQKEMLTMFDKAIEKAKLQIAKGNTTFDVVRSVSTPA